MRYISPTLLFLIVNGASWSFAQPASQTNIPTPPTSSSYIAKNAPPILLIHGAKDTVVFIDSTDEFYQRMKTAGAMIEYLRFEDGSHGVMGQKSRTTTPAMLEFFETHLRSGDESD